MSLKAKIEAVIYASEEPVTLQQLVGLLGQEAQAELDAADALQGQLALLDSDPLILVEEVESGDQDALNAETLGPEDSSASEPAADQPQTGNETTTTTASAQTPEPETPLDLAGNDLPLTAAPGAPTDEAGTPEPSSETGDSSASEADPSGLDKQPTGPQPEGVTAAETRARNQEARRLREYMRSVLDALIAEYRDNDRGLEIREVANGFRFATKPEYHDAVRGFVRSLKPPLKLSLQALETLAVVAYKQPVTSPEVSEIRGVDSGGVLGSLMTRKLVTTAGRKQVIGRPILYKTTKEFLLRFGLKDLSELPSIEEFERLASDINEAVQEEIPMDQGPENLKPGPPVGDAPRNIEPMRNEHHAQADGTPNGESDAYDDERLTPAPDGPGEFTGDESAPPADNASIDGRLSGLPPIYDEPADEGMDSPALDAKVQAAQTGNREGEE